MVEHMSLFNAAKQSLPFAQAIKHILHFQDVLVSHLSTYFYKFVSQGA